MLDTQGSGTVSYKLQEFHLNERKCTSKFNFCWHCIFSYYQAMIAITSVTGNPTRVAQLVTNKSRRPIQTSTVSLDKLRK